MAAGAEASFRIIRAAAQASERSCGMSFQDASKAHGRNPNAPAE